MATPFRVLCDDTNQNWWHSAQGLLVAQLELQKIYQQVSNGESLTTVSLLTDGASNYDCSAFLLALRDISFATGMHLSRHVIFEAGEGKSIADSDGSSVSVG